MDVPGQNEEANGYPHIPSMLSYLQQLTRPQAPLARDTSILHSSWVGPTKDSGRGNMDKFPYLSHLRGQLHSARTARRSQCGPWMKQGSLAGLWSKHVAPLEREGL